MKADALHLFALAGLALVAAFAVAHHAESASQRDQLRGQMQAVQIQLYDARARLDVLERVRVEVVVHDLSGYVIGAVFE